MKLKDQKISTRFWLPQNSFFLVGLFICIAQTGLAQDSVINQNLYPVWQESNWYLMDAEGKIQHETGSPDYVDFASGFNQFIVGKNNKYGVIRGLQDTLFSISYDTILCGGWYFVAQSGRNWTFYNYFNNEKTVINAERVVCWEWNFFVYDQDKKGIALKDSSGNLHFIEPKYDALMPYHGYFLTYLNHRFGLIDYHGKEVIGAIADEIQIDENGVISYFENYWKYILPGGRLIDPGYGAEVYFYSDLYWKIVSPDKRVSFYSKHRADPIMPGFDDYFLLNDSFFAFRSSGKSGLADFNGNILLQPEYEFIGWICDSVFYYKENDALGLLSLAGEKLTPAIYTDISSERHYESKFLKVCINGKYGVIDYNGKTIVSPVFAEVSVGINSFITYSNARYGLFNREGVELARPVYLDNEPVYSISDGATDSGRGNGFDIHRMFDQNSSDFFNHEEKLNSERCTRYSVGNNVIKCYCKSGLEVILLNEKGEVSDKTLYKDIIFVETRDTLRNRISPLNISSRNALLEENQETGEFTMRLTRKKGYGFEPGFKQVYETKYRGYYLGKLKKDTIVYSFFGLPLVAKSYDLSFSNSDGNLYTRDTLVAADLYRSDESFSGGTTFDFILNKDKQIDFFTPSVNLEKICYIEPVHNSVQRVYTDGEARISTNSDDPIFLWNLFCRYNQNNNSWFSSPGVVMEIMSEKNKIDLTGGVWRVIHGDRDDYKENDKPRVFNGSQEFSSFEKTIFESSHICSAHGKKYGVLGRFAEVVMDEKYDTIIRIHWNNATYFAGKIADGKEVFYSVDLKSELNSFPKPGLFTNGFAVLNGKKKKGVINYEERIVIDTIYKSVDIIGKGIFAVRTDKGYRLVNENNVTLGDSGYFSMQRINSENILVKKAGYGIISNDGKSVLSPEFDTLIILRSGLIYGKKKNIRALYSKEGLYIRDLLPEEKQKEERIIIKAGKKKYGIADGDKMTQFTSMTEPRFIGNLIQVKKGKIYEYFDGRETPLFRVNSSWSQLLSYGVKVIRDKRERIFLDSLNREFYRCPADEIIDFGEWIRIVHRDSSYLINISGNKIQLEKGSLPVRKSSEGRIVVKNRDGYVFYDREGNRLNTETYDAVRNFRNNYAAVMKNGKWGFIDLNGNIAVDFLFTSVSDFSEGKFSALKNPLFGLYSSRGENILPPVFEEIKETPSGIFLRNEFTSGYYLNQAEIIWVKED